MNRPGLLWIILGLITVTVLLLMVNNDAGTLFGLANESFARLVYLSVIVLVFSVSILSGRTYWRDAARNALLWVMIVLSLVTAYVYRYDLQDFGARLSGGLLPGSPVSTTNAEGRAVITLVRSGDGHFHARAAVEGARVDLLVDTGASVVVLSDADARRAGIDTNVLGYGTPVTTANGTARAARITLDRITIGAIDRFGLEAMVARPGALQTSLLGMNFLSTLTAFEIRGDRLILTD